MNQHQYLIPANTKSGKLILGWFRPFDLILFCCGIFITMFLLAFVTVTETWAVILVLSPAVITGFLVMPVPYYHNVLNILVEVYSFLTNRQTYRWKGWCYRDVITKDKK